ncbi:MAG TPA: DUF2892 domain-containing protein [Longimicrobium sp.]|nr:DUF2892 domain-containing protein [Longimicrobium sp.]
MRENVGGMDRVARAVAGPALMAIGFGRWGGNSGSALGLLAMLGGALITETAITPCARSTRRWAWTARAASGSAERGRPAPNCCRRACAERVERLSRDMGRQMQEAMR